MAKTRQHFLATTFGYETLRPYQKYLFMSLTGHSKGSFSSVLLANCIFSSRFHSYLHSHCSFPSAISSLSTHMGYSFRERNPPAGGYNKPRPKKMVGTRREDLACNIPCWAPITPSDSVLPSSQYHSAGSSSILGNRSSTKQESF